MSSTNTQTVARIGAVMAGFALVLTGFVPAVGAQTTSPTSATSSVSFQFYRDLTLGSAGADVTALQAWLISRGFSIPAGATGYYGNQTRAAVAAYQAANGIMPAAGFFGPKTRAQVNVSGGSTPTPDPTPKPTPTKPTPDNGGKLKGGAGSLDDVGFVSSIKNEKVGEGDEDVAVLSLDLEADDNSDLNITAVRVEFTLAAGTGSEDLDDYAQSVSLLYDGKEVGSRNVRNFSERNGIWSSTITLSKDAIIRMGQEGELTLALTAHENIDSDDLTDNEWTARVTSVRYVDAQGAVITDTRTGAIGETRAFEFATFAEANDVELNVDDSNNSPNEGTVEIDEDGDTEVTLLVGELSAKGSDITITELTAAITPNGTGDASEIAIEYILMIDGDEVDRVDSDECTVTASCNGSSTSTVAFYEFDDFEFTLDEGDSVEFEIIAVTAEIGTAFAEGDSLTAVVDAALIEAEDESDDLDDGALEGTARGEEQFLRSAGLGATVIEDKSSARADTSFGTFTFVIDVTAFGDDEIDLTVADFNYTVTGPTGATFTAAETLTAARSVEKNGSTYTLDDETGRFTFTVYLNPATTADSGVYRVTLNTIGDSAPVIVTESLSTFIYVRN